MQGFTVGDMLAGRSIKQVAERNVASWSTKCATEGCTAQRVGKSKYCKPHRGIARQRFMQMLDDNDAKKYEQARTFERLFMAADAAGKAAAAACVPAPMVVEQRAHPLDDSSPIVKQYAPVMDGVCGFAWVVFQPGNSALAHYAKKHHGATRAYEGGVSIWVGDYGQSYERKSAYAGAYAKVFADAGYRVWSASRLD